MRASQSGKALFPFIILVLIALCGYLYLPASNGNSKSFSGAPTQVAAVTIEKQSRDITINAIGSARANHALNVTSAQSDYISALYFDDGDRVKRGDKLAQLQDLKEQLAVQELEVNLKEEHRQLTRLTELAKTQSAARSQLDSQHAVVDALEIQLQTARTKLAEMAIYAPFNGILGQRLVSVGSFVDNNSVLATLDDISIIKVDFQVPEKYLAQLQLKMRASAASDAYPDKTFEGIITHIDPRIDDSTRSIRVTASFDNPQDQLRPGMLLHVSLFLGELNALMVPEKSLIPRQDKHFIYTISEGKAKQQQVSVLSRFQGWVAVDGLSAGQQVITEGTTKIRNGSAVVVKG
ncbi:efflux RND transporter periplasmic adaptor subunit [Pseudoalteromonas rubra]|uniref:efflux RND transporter periplasmic adaptor subunit n=1 Tax=Pseudoalteromonas rubra TaxID=43658 RepID=UPI000F7AF3B2|nr:efflux RND transporter periplasmic adaptor subunit [Pseudoalteromonas rubra]